MNTMIADITTKFVAFEVDTKKAREEPIKNNLDCLK